MTGNGDATYNTRRDLLGAISIGKEITYHLFNVTYSDYHSRVKLLRKSSWPSQPVAYGGKYRTNFSQRRFPLQ